MYCPFLNDGVQAGLARSKAVQGSRSDEQNKEGRLSSLEGKFTGMEAMLAQERTKSMSNFLHLPLS